MSLGDLLHSSLRKLLLALLTLAVLIAPVLSHATSFSAEQLKSLHQPVPGGVAVLDITGTGQGQTPAPTARYLNKPVLVARTDTGRWFAIVGIPLSAPIEKQELEVSRGGKKSIEIFLIRDKKYREQRITLKTNKHVDLSPEDLARYEREKNFKTMPISNSVRSPRATSCWIVQSRDRSRVLSVSSAFLTINPAHHIRGWISPFRPGLPFNHPLLVV